MFRSFYESFKQSEYWTYSTWLRFGLKYRKTMLGPIWLAVAPALFVIFLGYLYSDVMRVELNLFVPHLAIGYITWTLFSGFIVNASTVYVRRRSEILQGVMRLTDLSLADTFQVFLTFLHQSVVIIGVFVFFKIIPTPYALVSLVGFFLTLLNGLWLSVALGILGARFRDLVEIISAVTRLFFFITPIIWMPIDGKGGVLGKFLILNPFYHFLTIIRAPLLDRPIDYSSWVIVLSITALGFVFAAIVYKRASKQVPLWV